MSGRNMARLNRFQVCDIGKVPPWNCCPLLSCLCVHAILFQSHQLIYIPISFLSFQFPSNGYLQMHSLNTIRTQLVSRAQLPSSQPVLHLKLNSSWKSAFGSTNLAGTIRPYITFPDFKPFYWWISHPNHGKQIDGSCIKCMPALLQLILTWITKSFYRD
jgi:hypothetical protein